MSYFLPLRWEITWKGISSPVFGSVGTALWIGNLLPNAAGRSVMYNALLGVLVIGLAGFFPLIGFFIGIVFGILSLGVVIVTRFGVNSLTAS